MTTPLADLIANGNGRKATWDGTTVHALIQIAVKPGDSIVVTRLSASATRAQALKLAADRGDLRANGILASEVAMWTHTSPDEISIEVVDRKARTIEVWNSWSFDGVDSSWLGNAGIISEPTADGQGQMLRCSDGLGNPSFDDLVVEVRVSKSG